MEFPSGGIEIDDRWSGRNGCGPDLPEAQSVWSLIRNACGSNGFVAGQWNRQGAVSEILLDEPIFPPSHVKHSAC